MNNLFLYPFEIKPLTKEEGGGYLISFPDFDECISDGETPEEAIKNGFSALQETIDALHSMGFPIPEPFNREKKVQQISKNLHQRLEALARKKKVSINSLINSLLEESLTNKEADIIS